MSAFRIHRYIAREIAVPFFLGLLIFTFVLLMGRVLKLVELVINKGVPFGDIARLFLYLLPSFLVLTLPLAFLLGVLLAFGRLSSDSEVTALKATGVSLYQMARPAMLLSLAVCLATAGLTLVAEPVGRSAFRNQIFQIASSRASVGIQARVFNDEFDGLVIYANDIRERSGVLEGVFVSDERQESAPSIILAKTGRVISDPKELVLTLRLEDGSIHRRPKDRDSGAYQIVRFSKYDISLDFGQELNAAESRPKKTKEMTTEEIRKALQTSDLSHEGGRPLEAELHKRFALPLAPVVFALIGLPLGIHSSRSGRGGGFALALAVSLLYYFLISGAKTGAEEGFLPPGLAMWVPNILFLAGGILLFQQAAREKRPALFDWVLDMLAKARHIGNRTPKR